MFDAMPDLPEHYIWISFPRILHIQLLLISQSPLPRVTQKKTTGIEIHEFERLPAAKPSS